MIKIFKKSHNIQRNASDHFYLFYFEKEAHRMQIEVSNFYYPLSKNHKKENRTLNSKYFELILSVPKFTNDFKDYMEHHLFNDYKQDIDKKSESLASKFEQWN